MNIRARPYRDGADLAAKRQLLILGERANIAASYMHPGCLDWAAFLNRYARIQTFRAEDWQKR